MTESEFLTRFKACLESMDPTIFVYKIPDTKGTGGNRPFDMVVIYKKRTYVIEGKKNKTKKPTDYQRYWLGKGANNGAIPVILFPENQDYWIEEIMRGL